MKVSLHDISVQLPGMDRALFAIQSCEIASGERVLIQGPSGRGKTTLLHLMAGLLSPVRGRVLLDDRDLSREGESDRARFRREHVGLIFQKLNLISHLTTLENVQLASDWRTTKTSEVRENAISELKKVKLSEQVDVLALNLSVGQQQRVAVARLLAQKPKLALADEPTSSLDDDTAEAVMRALLGLPKSTTVVVVSHDHRIRRHFTRIVEFDQLVKS